MTPILSDTLAPPSTTTNGRSGSLSSLPSISSSRVISSPATAGRQWAMPSVEACARCAAPKASLTKTSASDASWAANAGSLAVSSAWKRTFSSSSIWPGREGTRPPPRPRGPRSRRRSAPSSSTSVARRRSHRSQAQLLHDLALGPAQMRRQHQRAALLDGGRRSWAGRRGCACRRPPRRRPEAR